MDHAHHLGEILCHLPLPSEAHASFYRIVESAIRSVLNRMLTVAADTLCSTLLRFKLICKFKIRGL